MLAPGAPKNFGVCDNIHQRAVTAATITIHVPSVSIGSCLQDTAKGKLGRRSRFWGTESKFGFR